MSAARAICARHSRARPVLDIPRNPHRRPAARPAGPAARISQLSTRYGHEGRRGARTGTTAAKAASRVKADSSPVSSAIAVDSRSKQQLLGAEITEPLAAMVAMQTRVTVRVAVQSPRRLLRDTLAACLAVRPDVAVVGRVAEPDGILALCELRRPDVVILDAGGQLGDMAGRVGALVRRFPDLNVIVTYRDASEQDVAAACRAGVSSLVPESRGLVAVLALLRRKKGDHAPDARRERGGLTDREHEIVVLTGSGHSVTEIAALLGISPLTVENLKRRVYAKLDVSSGAHAVARAASLGMLERETAAAPRRHQAEGGGGVLAVVAGRPGPDLDRVVVVLLENKLPFVLIRRPGPVADTHWARWHRGPIVAALVDPAPPDWDLVAEMGIPAVLVHSQPLDSPDPAEALAPPAGWTITSCPCSGWWTRGTWPAPRRCARSSAWCRP